LGGRVRNAVDRFSQQAEQKGVEFRGPDAGEIYVEADPDLMDRVIWNLLGNALKFTPPGGEIGIQILKEDGSVTLEVTDTGPGIPAEKLRSVFDRFFRIDEARTSGEETSGTGLGLAIVKAIVELHRGSVSADNRPGGGAVFRVTLPAAEVGSPNMKTAS
jgi:signal transduction histidine kinase